MPNKSTVCTFTPSAYPLLHSSKGSIVAYLNHDWKGVAGLGSCSCRHDIDPFTCAFSLIKKCWESMFNYLSSHCSTALCLQYLVCILLQPAFVRFTGMPTSAGAPAQPANLSRIYPVTIIFPLAFQYPSIKFACCLGN